MISIIISIFLIWVIIESFKDNAYNFILFILLSIIIGLTIGLTTIVNSYNLKKALIKNNAISTEFINNKATIVLIDSTYIDFYKLMEGK
jgi:uncharacterized protein YneF (UPF0154 family)